MRRRDYEVLQAVFNKTCRYACKFYENGEYEELLYQKRCFNCPMNSLLAQLADELGILTDEAF